MPLFCVVSLSLFAQEARHIIVRDATTSKAIPSAIVTGYDKTEQRISYKLSNNKGEVVLPSAPNLYKIVVRKMGYTDVVKVLSDERVTTVLMSEESIVLPEFSYLLPAVVRKSDTLSFNAQAFITTGDRYLRDLIGKLPGVTIADNGIVKYEGETIKRFYIEGKDLLGSQYGLATNTLPVDAISSVEVLERHQDVKILRDIVPEQKASMNIKLKETYKVRPFGYAEVGVGYRPLLYQGRLNMVKVSKDPVQYFIYGQGDNTGIKSESGRFAISSLEIDGLSPDAAMVYPVVRSSRPIADQHFVENNSALLTGNSLVVFNDESQLRINVSGQGEKLKHNIFTDEYYALNGIRIREEEQSSGRELMLRPTFSYERNSSNMYLTNILYGSFVSGRGKQQVEGQVREFEYNPRSEQFWIQNTFRATVPLNKKKLLGEVFGKLLWNQHSGDWGLGDLPLKGGEFQANHGVATNFNLGGQWWLNLGADHRIYYRYYDNTHRVELLHSKTTLSPSFDFRFSKKNGSFSFKPSATHYYERIDGKTSTFWALAPSIYFYMNWRERVKLNISSTYTPSLALPSSLFATPCRVSHRMLVKDYFGSNRKATWWSIARLSYSNIFEYLFANITVSYTQRWESLLWDFQLSDDGYSVAMYKAYSNQKRSLITSASLDKSFRELGINLILDGYLSFSSGPSSFNGVISEGRGCSYKLGLESRYDKISWLYLSLKSEYLGSVSERGGAGIKYTTDQLSNKVQLRLSPLPTLGVSAEYEWNTFIRNKSNLPDFHMLHLRAEQQISKRSSILLECANLLDEVAYTISSHSPIAEVTTSLPLRRRRVVASWRFSF